MAPLGVPPTSGFPADKVQLLVQLLVQESVQEGGHQEALLCLLFKQRRLFRPASTAKQVGLHANQSTRLGDANTRLFVVDNAAPGGVKICQQFCVIFISLLTCFDPLVSANVYLEGVTESNRSN